MRILAIELHISVIRDLAELIKPLGHVLDVRWWSGSLHLLEDRKMAQQWQSLHVNAGNWKTALCDPRAVRAFQREYAYLLEQYDAFFVTHAPILCRLYQGLGKPIICVNSCRWTQPYCWSGNHEAQRNIAGLARDLAGMTGEGLLHIVSNNLGDQDFFAKTAPGLRSTLIPSCCTYAAEDTWNPQRRDALIYSRTPGLVPACFPFPKNYSYSQIASYRLCVVLPYEISTMTLFELYAIGIPLLAPSQRLWLELMKTRDLPFTSDYGQHSDQGKSFWVSRSDIFNMPGIRHYDSMFALSAAVVSITDTELKAMSVTMLEEVQKRVRRSRDFIRSSLVQPCTFVAKSRRAISRPSRVRLFSL
jgi:hypothetical protein